MSIVDEQRRRSRAGAVARSQVRQSPSREVSNVNGHLIRLTDVLGDGMVFYDYVDGSDVCFMNEESWEILRADDEGGPLRTFFSSWMSSGGSGLHYMSSAPWWNRNARLHAEQVGKGVVKAKDVLTQLTERLDRLVVSAAGYADGSTDRETMVHFFSEVSTAEQEYEEVQLRLGKLYGRLQLAQQVVTALR